MTFRLNKASFLLSLFLIFLDKGYVPEQNTMSTCLEISTNVVSELKRPSLVVDYSGGDFTPQSDFLNIINKAHKYLDRRFSYENREVESRVSLAEDAYQVDEPDAVKYITRIDLEDSDGNIIPNGALQRVTIDWLRDKYGELFSQVDSGQPKYWARGLGPMAATTSYERVESVLQIAVPDGFRSQYMDGQIYKDGVFFTTTEDEDGGTSIWGFSTVTGALVLENQFAASGLADSIASLTLVDGYAYVVAIGDTDFTLTAGQRWGFYKIDLSDGTISDKISMGNAGWGQNGASILGYDGTYLYIASANKIAKVDPDGTYGTIATVSSPIMQVNGGGLGADTLWITGCDALNSTSFVAGYSYANLTESVAATLLDNATSAVNVHEVGNNLYIERLPIVLLVTDLSEHHTPSLSYSISETTYSASYASTAYGTGDLNRLKMEYNSGTESLVLLSIEYSEITVVDENALIIMPPADEDYTAVIHHASYATAMADNNDVSWWSDKHPDILELAIKRQIAIDLSRNKAEQQDYEADIETGLYDVETDAAMERQGGRDATRRFGWRP